MQVLDARNKIIGVEHPDTINTMGNLAATYLMIRKYTEAEKLNMQVLDARNRIPGVEHPHTITTMANLAATYQHLGRYSEAEQLQIQVLDARNRILGVEHPHTITAMANLAATSRNLGKYCTNSTNLSATCHRGSEIEEILRDHRSQGPPTKPPGQSKIGVKNRIFPPLSLST